LYKAMRKEPALNEDRIAAAQQFLPTRPRVWCREEQYRMQYRALGRTGLTISEISLGCMELGMPPGTDLPDYRWTPSIEDGVKLIHQALELGVNFFDTARIYGDSERIVGQATRDRRDACYLATKVMVKASSEAEVRAEVQESVQRSLTELETDYVDLLQLHCGTTEQIERGWAFEEMCRFRDAGKARHLGITVSTYEIDAAAAALEHGGYETLQPSFNVLYQEPATRLFSMAAERGIGILAKMPLWQGMPAAVDQFTDEQRTAYPFQRKHFFERMARFNQFCNEQQSNRFDVMLAFILAHPQVSAAIPGTRRAEHLAQNVAVSGKHILSIDQTELLRREVGE
jgi:aryl-alcohol dehydrogenase-like predicted oxidoreductase